MSRLEGGVGTMSSSVIVRRLRLSAGALRATAGAGRRDGAGRAETRRASRAAGLAGFAALRTVEAVLPVAFLATLD
jgi:hypothetical protein